MDNRKFIEDLKTLLNSHFNNDVELLAKSIGIPEDQIYELLSGVNDPTHELVDKLKKYSPEKEENYFQFGSRVEINNSGDGYSQSFADMMSDKDREKYLKKENSDLHKLIKGKDELLKDKDELLSEKDKLISALQETIELLKNK